MINLWLFTRIFETSYSPHPTLPHHPHLPSLSFMVWRFFQVWQAVRTGSRFTQLKELLSSEVRNNAMVQQWCVSKGPESLLVWGDSQGCSEHILAWSCVQTQRKPKRTYARPGDCEAVNMCRGDAKIFSKKQKRKKSWKDLKFKCDIQYIQMAIWLRMQVLTKVTDHKICPIIG